MDGVKQLDVRMTSCPPHAEEAVGGVGIDLVKGRSYRLRIEYARVPRMWRHVCAWESPVRRDWVAEDGAFELLAGSSSRDIRARRAVELVA